MLNLILKGLRSIWKGSMSNNKTKLVLPTIEKLSPTPRPGLKIEENTLL